MTDRPARSASASSSRAAPTPTAGSSWPASVEDLGYSTADDARPLHRPAGAGAGAASAAADATDHAARRRARVRQRLQAPGRAGQGAGDDGRAVATAGSRSASAPAGWTTDYEQSGIPYDRAGRAHRPLRRGPRRHQGRDGRRAVLVRRRALHDHRLRRPRPSRCSGRTRRSSSAAAASGCSSIAAREADIVGINGTMAAGVIGPEALAHDDRRGGRRARWRIVRRGRRRPRSTTSS